MITMSEQGLTLEITRTKGANRRAKIRRIDKDHYEDIRTGEIKEFKHDAENRKDNKESVLRSLSNLRAIVNTNTAYPRRVLWITLTYAENMTDPDRLRKDYAAFWGRFKYYCEKEGHKKPEYIVVAEPQNRGAWHLHCLFIFPGRRPYIPNDKMAEIWGHGYSKTKRITGGDNISGYLCAYLTDMSLYEITGDKTKKKAIVKGARLELYPKGFHLFRCSKGIKRPKKEEITYEEMLWIDEECTFTGKRVIEFKDRKTGYEAKVIKKWYKIPADWRLKAEEEENKTTDERSNDGRQDL